MNAVHPGDTKNYVTQMAWNFNYARAHRTKLQRCVQKLPIFTTFVEGYKLNSAGVSWANKDAIGDFRRRNVFTSNINPFCAPAVITMRPSGSGSLTGSQFH